MSFSTWKIRIRKSCSAMLSWKSTPQSIFAEAVDAGLTNAYYDKQDWKDFYAAADKALALKPDDVDVLSTVGWVIPHFYNPHDRQRGPAIEQGGDLRETRYRSDGDNAQAGEPDGRPVCRCESVESQ